MVDIRTTKQHGFQKGQSGNPKGRPPGSRNKALLAIEALMDGKAEEITIKAIDLALAGDSAAMRLIMDRIAPARRGRRQAIDLGDLAPGADGLANAATATLQALSRGELSPEESLSVMGVIDACGAALDRRRDTGSDLEAKEIIFTVHRLTARHQIDASE